MAKISSSLFLMSRRAYSVAAEKVTVRSAAPPMRKAASASDGAASGKETFWMRDPNTGNWMPESHIGKDDAAELRSKLLSKKPNSSN